MPAFETLLNREFFKATIPVIIPIVENDNVMYHRDHKQMREEITEIVPNNNEAKAIFFTPFNKFFERIYYTVNCV